MGFWDWLSANAGNTQGAPYGVGMPQEQAQNDQAQTNAVGGMVGGLYNSLYGLAKSNFDNSEALRTGNPDQFSGRPAFDAGMLTMGATPFGMTKGGVNIGHGPNIPLSFTERMEQGKQVAMDAYNRGAGGGSYGFSAKGRTAPDAPKGSADRFIQENQAGWQHDKQAALDAYRQTVNPQESQHLLAPGESYADFANGFSLGAGSSNKAAGLANTATALGDGSRNYVVFDPKIIEIMRKYGIALPGAAGAAAGALPPPKQQAPIL